MIDQTIKSTCDRCKALGTITLEEFTNRRSSNALPHTWTKRAVKIDKNKASTTENVKYIHLCDQCEGLYLKEEGEHFEEFVKSNTLSEVNGDNND